MGAGLNIPTSVEQALTRSGGDPVAEFKEAALVELYRMGRLSHGEFAEGLGISRLEADAILRRHQVTEDMPSADDIGWQLIRLRKLVGWYPALRRAPEQTLS